MIDNLSRLFFAIISRTVANREGTEKGSLLEVNSTF